jgi:galactan endo-1,6-beta-galactosidase
MGISGPLILTKIWLTRKDMSVLTTNNLSLHHMNLTYPSPQSAGKRAAMFRQYLLCQLGRRPVLTLIGCCLLAALPVAHADYTATPVPTTTWGSWDAWGTSLAWMGKAFGNQTAVADVLFGTTPTTFNGTSVPGLGLNFVRYNAGACGVGSVGGQSMVIINLNPAKQIQGYWLNPNSSDPASASWDWSVDANQRAMLLNAKARGANRFELFANSPMWWMLDNFNPAGNGTTDNLNTADTEQFAIELATIAKYAQTNWGIDFTTVEGFNEPVSSYWSATGGQEGCHFANGNQPGVISALRTELNNRGLNSVAVSASDDNQVDQALRTWDSFSAATQAQVGQINTHGYQGYGRGGNQAGLYTAASSVGKRLYNSEYGDNDTSGMTMATTISYNLYVLHPTGWTYWQALDGSNWGMVNANIDTGSIGAVEPKYFIMAQYSRHIRQGMTIIESGDTNSVVAYDPVAQKLVIVTANHATAQTITFNLANYAVANGPITRWVTAPGAGTYYAEDTSVSLSGKTFSSAFAANSVQTFEIQNVSANANGILADGTYKIINRNSGKALDAFGQGITNGTPVDQFTYNATSNQKWTVTNLGNGQYSIADVQSGRLLDVTGASTANGALVDTWASNGGSNQKWTIAATSGGYYSVESVKSGKALDVVGGAATNGAPVDQWTYTGGANQQWEFQAP